MKEHEHGIIFLVDALWLASIYLKKYLNLYTSFGFYDWYFIVNSKPWNYNVNSTCLKDIKSWYVQKRKLGSNKIPSLDELQVIDLEHDDTPDTEVGTFEVEITNASTHEPAPSISISSPRRRTSKHTRTSPAVGERVRRRVVRDFLLK